MRDYIREIAELRSQITTLQASINTATPRSSRGKGAVLELSRQLAELKIEIGRVRSENSHLRARKNSIDKSDVFSDCNFGFFPKSGTTPSQSTSSPNLRKSELVAVDMSASFSEASSGSERSSHRPVIKDYVEQLSDPPKATPRSIVTPRGILATPRGNKASTAARPSPRICVGEGATKPRKNVAEKHGETSSKVPAHTPRCHKKIAAGVSSQPSYVNKSIVGAKKEDAPPAPVVSAEGSRPPAPQEAPASSPSVVAQGGVTIPPLKLAGLMQSGAEEWTS